jgi:hypothetical protein
MSRTALMWVSFILLLIVYPLTALGTDGISPVLWWVGLAALLLGGLIPPVLHFVGPGTEGNGEESQKGGQQPEADGSGKRKGAVPHSSTLTGLTPTGAPPGRDLPRRVKKQLEESSRKGEAAKKDKGKRKSTKK